MERTDTLRQLYNTNINLEKTYAGGQDWTADPIRVKDVLSHWATPANVWKEDSLNYGLIQALKLLLFIFK